MVESIKDLRVLIVEDNAETLNLVKSMLGELDVDQVTTAKNGRQGLDFLGMSDELIDIILCDWNMPEVTGLELLQQIREVDPDLPFLMITGAIDVQSVMEAKSAGVTGYIAKPFSRDELEKKLSAVARMLQFRSSTVYV